MIKGVTKKIVEINNPNSIYFEKAIFYLKPNVHELTDEVSQIEINRCAAKFGLDFEKKKHSAGIGKIVIFLLLALSIAAISITFMN